MGTEVLKKGCYVSCTVIKRVGVISDPIDAKNGCFVRWLTDWDPDKNVVQYYMEYIRTDNLMQLPLSAVTPGLEALRRKIIR